MIFLLSPAKSLLEGPAIPDLDATQPEMLDQSVELLETVRALSADDLGSLMSISEKLATLNHERFQTFSTPLDRTNARQAARMFDGDVYKGLDAASLSADDLKWAQERVGILSGFYGLLRPLDLMSPYRLEMGTRLENPRGKNLYGFWGDRITERLRARLDAAGSNTIVDLASKEYSRSVKPKVLGARWITPVFKDTKDGKTRIISFFAKRARGAMLRWAVENRITTPEQLHDCDAMGYRFQEQGSSGDTWLFTRKQPPPAGN